MVIELENSQQVVKALRYLMDVENLSQAQFAEKVGITQSGVSRALGTKMDVEKLAKYAQALGYKLKLEFYKP